MKTNTVVASNGSETLDRRKTDALTDRRKGEDRRQVYDADYFEGGGSERRNATDRRWRDERRKGCIRVSKWSSVCPSGKSAHPGSLLLIPNIL